jgi:hypothetical protein
LIDAFREGRNVPLPAAYAEAGMMLGFARAGLSWTDVEAMPVELAEAVWDLLLAQAQASVEESARAR